jgi:predicted nucleotidyltransferase component of viral defense system
MSKAESPGIIFHEDVEPFREALRFTAAESGFGARLIEKDYFCTALLAYLCATRGGLVFKGGTCLAKVHAGFYRLSEDLDFDIPASLKVSRSGRQKLIEESKSLFEGLSKRLSGLRLVQPLKGANNSTQYVAVVGYTSVLSPQEQNIKIEISLREPLLVPPVRADARTLLLDPVSREAVVPPISVVCMAKTEAYAEKFRAALSRRDVAIRDFYDIDHAVRKGGLNPEDEELVKQVRQKLGIPGNEAVDVSEKRLSALRQQIDPQLRPVLRELDFGEFDLERAFKIVVAMAKAAG